MYVTNISDSEESLCFCIVKFRIVIRETLLQRKINERKRWESEGEGYYQNGVSRQIRCFVSSFCWEYFVYLTKPIINKIWNIPHLVHVTKQISHPVKWEIYLTKMKNSKRWEVIKLLCWEIILSVFFFCRWTMWQQQRRCRT